MKLSILKKTIIVIITTVVLVFTAFALYNNLNTYYKNSNELNSKAERILNRLQYNLINPLWDLNLEQVNIIVELEMEDPSIAGIIIKDTNGKKYVSRIRNDKWKVIDGSNIDIAKDDYPVYKEAPILKNKETIGHIEIYLTDYFIREHLNGLYSSSKMILKRLQFNLTEALWLFNKEQAAVISELEMSQPSVSGITITDDYGKEYISRKRNDKWDIVEGNIKEDKSEFAVYQKAPITKDGITLGYVELFLTDKFVQEQVRRDAIFEIIKNATVVILLVLLLTLLIRRLVIRPITSLVNDVGIIGSGNYNHIIEVKSRDEIRKLGDAMNDMVSKIKEYSEHLEDMVAQRTKELNETNEKLILRNEIMEEELNMAQRVQQSMIPIDSDFPKRREMGFGSKYSAMESIGGDLYDVIRVGRNGYGFLIADVSGHGVPAALITSMAKVSFNSHSDWGITPAEVCDKVNKELYGLIGDLEYYLTAHYSIINLENGELQYTNAGHHPAIVINSETGKTKKLDTEGFFIGALEDTKYETKEVKIEPGDKILLFTDGIIEARNPNDEFYEYERLMEYIQKNHSESPKNFVDGLIKDIERFCDGREADDDRAILFIQIVSHTSSTEAITEDSVIIEARNIERENTTQSNNFKEQYRKALAYIKSAEYEKALNDLLKLKEKHPENAKILNSLGIVYYKMSKLIEAKDILQYAVDRDKGNSVIKRNLDKVLKKLE